MPQLSDSQIIESWNKNAAPWITAVRKGEIESRVLVTNEAITTAILDQAPQSVLDIGCGEGWLARALCEKGIKVHGIDVVEELIQKAQELGGGEFRCMAYENLDASLFMRGFDLAVCNFSLLGKESVERIFRQVPELLNNSGVFVVQTAHPLTANGDSPYEDGWRPGSWAGFSEDFSDPAPWYFRTIESWKELFFQSGFSLDQIIEPLHPKTQKPASIIFIGRLEKAMNH